MLKYLRDKLHQTDHKKYTFKNTVTVLKLTVMNDILFKSVPLN